MVHALIKHGGLIIAGAEKGGTTLMDCGFMSGHVSETVKRRTCWRGENAGKSKLNCLFVCVFSLKRSRTATASRYAMLGFRICEPGCVCTVYI